MSDSAGPIVVAVDEQAALVVDLQRWSALAEAVLGGQGAITGELNLLFVEATEMQDLNRTHMGKDRPTDVLSFPLDGAEASGADALIGDVVICPSHAAQNAAEHEGIDHHTGSIEDEIALLVVHGMLHVLGHDHGSPDEAIQMEALEQELLAAYHR